MTARSGGQILAEQLAVHGVDTAFCVPGESYLALLDGLVEHPEIRVITHRHEAAAANAADAYGKLTGRPGICMVTRGPGATHASTGIHTAFQDSTPMILLIGQIGTDVRGREAFQEVDYGQMFGSLAKLVIELDDPARIPEHLARAFATAVSGRPGPVVVALPENVLSGEADVPDAQRYRPAQAHPGEADLGELQKLLATADRPLAIVGGGGWTQQGAADMQAFCEQNGIPVGAAFRCQDVIDNGSPAYVGDVGIGINPKLAARVRSCDVLLVVGARLGESATSGYTLVGIPTPAQPLVHVHNDPEELGRTYHPTVAIVSGLPEFAAAARALEPVDGARFAGWREEARADYLANLEAPAPIGSGVDLAAVVQTLHARLPDAIVANGAGNYTVWPHRFWQFSRYRSQLGPTSGAMGYGGPAAIAAAIVEPSRQAIAFAGDGCFLMWGSELATMVRERLPILTIVCNNGMYGTIRMHQERTFPARVIATDLTNPDFAAYARSFGAFGELVERTEQFAGALERALAFDGPALLELRQDPEALTPRQSLSAARAEGKAS